MKNSDFSTKYADWDKIKARKSEGVIGSSWIRQIMAAYDALQGQALKEFPYLGYWITQDFVDRKWIRPLVGKGYERSGYMFLAALARFSNPAGLGSIYEAMMRAPTLRHGLGVLAFESTRFDRELEYSFANYKADDFGIDYYDWVIEYRYNIPHPQHLQASVVIQASALIKYFTAFHGEPPLPTDIWVEMNLPRHDLFLLNKAMSVPVTIGKSNRLYLRAGYASRASLHTGPDKWARIMDKTDGLTAKHWAERVAMTVSCWDYTLSPPTVDVIAAQLNLTTATLRNRLKPGGYKIKDVMKESEMRRVRNSLKNGMSLKEVQELYGFAQLRDLKACYKRYLKEDITKAKVEYIKSTGLYL